MSSLCLPNSLLGIFDGLSLLYFIALKGLGMMSIYFCCLLIREVCDEPRCTQSGKGP